jgi:universal stress protein A
VTAIGFSRILLPVDFSIHGEAAAAYAAWFAQMSNGTVHLVHVIANPADPLYEPQEVAYWVMVEHAQTKAMAMLEQTARQSLPANCPHECLVLQGDPADKLIEAAKRIQPDVIVMATHGRSALAHLMMGSVVEKIVRHAPCPVFVARRAPE